MAIGIIGIRTVLFLDGTTTRKAVHVYAGACMAGDPTAYVWRAVDAADATKGEVMVWVKPGGPGESASFVEVA